MLTETVQRPFGKGYEGFEEFFSRYCSDANESGSSPDLALSLMALAGEEAQEIIRRIGPRPVCLIQGITCPRNGVALRQYLAQAAAFGGAIDPDIFGIDIMDVERLAREAGTELSHVSFSVGDATRMDNWSDGSVDLLVQDHLLNCAPNGSHQAILREAGRVLSPEGVMILNFSVEPDAGQPRLSWREAERILGAPLTADAYCLRDIAGDQRFDAAQHGLVGTVIADPLRGRELVVTGPYGNFEFYSPLVAIERMLQRAGLRFIMTRSVPGARCVRYRTLVERIGEMAG